MATKSSGAAPKGSSPPQCTSRKPTKVKGGASGGPERSQIIIERPRALMFEQDSNFPSATLLAV